jgi:predicted choloylglycine hydrolase
MSPDLPPQQPLVVVRLRGSQSEMGRQFGELSAEHGGFAAATSLYTGPPTMAARMVAAGLPFPVRRPVERVADRLFAAQRSRLYRRRLRRFPEYSTRTDAGFAAMDIPAEKASAVFVMDVLQNAIGLVSRTGLFDHTSIPAVPSCSSLAVWGAATTDGTLLHARNFDFPGASIWDLAPLVVFCEPTDGVRYGFVTTRGVDAPGITCFNEAGLTLTVHTRFHHDVSYTSPSVIDLGHEVIRTSRTLDEAVAVVRRLGAASTWGILISSASEGRAVVVETTGHAVEVVEPTAGDAHLSHTNRYLSPTFRRGEVTTSNAFVIDSDSRHRQLEDFVAKSTGGIDADALEELLGDHAAPGIIDRSDDVQRLSGNSVVSPVSVGSIVSEPAHRRIRVSVGRAPSGYGPYVQVPWSWDGPVGVVDAGAFEVGPVRGRSHRGDRLTDDERHLAHRLSALTQAFIDRAAPHQVRAELEDLCHRAPGEPGLHGMAAFLAIVDDEMDLALVHLDRALALEATPQPRARLLLYRSRVLEVLGRSGEARAARDELATITDPSAAHERHAGESEATKPLSRRRLRLISPDLMVLDAHL